MLINSKDCIAAAVIPNVILIFALKNLIINQ